VALIRCTDTLRSTEEKCMKASDVVKFAKENGVKMIDCKFIDLPGLWQHINYPVDRLEEGLEEGFGFDGSSIRGWKAINNSDMLMKPDPSTAMLDPFHKVPTLSLICDIADPITGEPYERCPRGLARRAEAYIKSTGIADTAYVGPEAEFYIFDDIRFDEGANRSYYEVDSVEGRWNTGRSEEGGNKGYKPNFKGGYFPVSPVDTYHDLRTEMCLVMERCGLEVETHHHEVGTAGQAEIDFKYGTMVQTGDRTMWFKYIVKNVAKAAGKTVTFMPKPLFGDNGSGMHTHQSLWKNEKPLFAGDQYAGLSEIAMFYIGGILKHAHAICAFANPSVNSYKRLVPGYEAPVNLAYSARNRSAAIRIPVVGTSPKAKRIEFRSPDPSANPYLAFAAMVMAGLDGVENRIHPGDPLDKDIYALSPEELKEVPHVPFTLEQSLDALRKDHSFLLKGDVFSPDLLDAWIDFKMSAEVQPCRMRPTPAEFALYYDI
jgi:glutamine synthetase